MAHNRKRNRNLHVDEMEFMPLSKRINNLHINTNLFFENATVVPPHNAGEWAAGLTSYSAGGSQSPDAGPEAVPNMSYNACMPQYNPVLKETENPHYFYKNKLLFEMHMQRLQRNGQTYQ